MAITRANLGLALCALLLIALRVLAGGDRATQLVESAAFGAFDPDQILRISLTDPMGNVGSPLVLERNNANSPWTVEARRGFPALSYPIETLLAAIDNLRLTDLVSEESSSHDLFGVSEGRGLELAMQSPGGDLWRFVLGGMARGAGGTRMYMRSLGESRVFAATGTGTPSLEPRSWIDPSLVDFDVTLVMQIELQVAGASIVLRRNDNGIWRDTQKNKVASRIAVENLIGEASGLVLTDVSTMPLDPENQGLGEDALRVIFTGDPEKADGFAPIELVLGGSESAEQRLLSGGGSRTRQYIRNAAWGQLGGATWVGLSDGDAANAFMTHVLEILSDILAYS